MRTPTIYVFVRNDLKPGQQMAQAVHAALLSGRWWIPPPDVRVICGESSPSDLEGLPVILASRGVEWVDFREPDLGNVLTAIATRATEERLGPIGIVFQSAFSVAEPGETG